MKKLIFMICILINIPVFSNYVKISEIENGNIKKAWRTNDKCGNECIQIPFGYNNEYHVMIDEYINDISKPIYEAKSNVVICEADEEQGITQEEDCIAKELAQICDFDNDYFIVRLQNNSEVYCTKLIGYEQKATGNKIIVEDADKKADYLAVQALKKAQDEAEAQALARMDHGRKVIALLIVRNAAKGLNEAQIVQMNSDYASIKGLLETGSLNSAKSAISALTVDGIIVTNDDKTALISKIDSFVGL